MNKICTRVHLNTSKSPSGYYEITKYGPNDSPISKLVDVINHETYDFGKIAESVSGTLLNPLHQKIISILAKGNSTQAAASVPKYTCQGKSKVYNQLIHNGDFVGTSNWDASTSTLTASDNVATFTASAQYGRITQRYIPFVNGHKYVFLCAIKQSSAHTGTYIMYTKDSNQTIGTSAATTDWQARQVIFTFTQTSGSGAIVIGDNRSGGWDSTLIKNVMLVDLTTIYGAGNEPATVSAFLADYPFFADYVAYTTGAIHSISSITLGGQTVSVDLRSAGSVYDEWASNSRGTRKVGVLTIAAANVSLLRSYTDVLYYGINKPANMYGYGGYTNIPLLNNGGWTQLVDDWSSAAHIGTYATGASQTQIWFGFSTTTTLAEAQAALDGLIIQYQLGNSYVAPFTAGSPLTLASWLTPTDQDGNAVTFTEGTEATPSPNYPVPIVNSTLISITDGQDTNSASVYLAGLTDKDELYVNCSDIPSGYQRLLYVEATGSQYISTGRSFDNGFKIDIDIEKTNTNTDSACIIGFQNVSEPYCRNWFNINNVNGNTQLYIGYGNTATPASITGLIGRSRVEASNVYGNRYMRVNGTSYSVGASSESSYGSGNLYLFCLHYGTRPSIQYIKANIYSCKIWDNATLVYDLVPCKRKSDDAVGFYNLVDDTFIASDGDAFVAGTAFGRVMLKQQVGRLDLSTRSWSYSSASKKFYAALNNVAYVSSSAVGDILCTNYIKASAAQLNDDPYDLHCAILNGNEVQVKNLAYTNPTTFGNDQSGVMLYYPLSSPVWTDITSSAMGAALLALETMEETSNTITINNSGVIDMVQYWKQM